MHLWACAASMPPAMMAAASNTRMSAARRISPMPPKRSTKPSQRRPIATCLREAGRWPNCVDRSSERARLPMSWRYYFECGVADTNPPEQRGR
jgi:hypothetical protein